MLVVPIVIALIFLVLYLTYHDLADAVLMMLAVPGRDRRRPVLPVALGSEAFGDGLGRLHRLFRHGDLDRNHHAGVSAQGCRKGGRPGRISLPSCCRGRVEGAVHRLRPKLLTEGTVVIGLAPMLWASGVGAEIIRPMAAPVLGGILVADEVIDLLLPVLFYWVRRWRWEQCMRAMSSRRRAACQP